MSENLDLVRSIYADWERGDYFSGEGEWIDPEIEYVIADGPDAGRWHGRAGLIAGARVILGAWENWRPEAEEYLELDDECVLVLAQFSGHGKTSGLEVGRISATGANLFYVRGGKVTKLVLYWDRERALEDLGLTPERGAAEHHSGSAREAAAGAQHGARTTASDRRRQPSRAPRSRHQGAQRSLGVGSAGA
jgi:ketosteroid isomerase-like protein